MDAILDGTVDTTEMDTWMAAYVRGLADGNMKAMNTVQLDLTLEEYMNFWK